MKRVRCFLPNAGDLINGIAFQPCADGGVESVDALADDIAAQFDGINGYALIPVEDKPGRKPKKSEE